MEIKEGDKVKFIEKSRSAVTQGKVYIVTKVEPEGYGETPDRKLIHITDNDGDDTSFFAYRFEKVMSSMVDMVELGKSYIGQKCNYSAGFTINPIYVHCIIDSKLIGAYPKAMNDEFNEKGYSVFVSELNNYVCVKDITVAPQSHTLKITDDYNAVVSKDKVEVGCQTITREIVDELHKLMHSFD